MNTDDTTLAPGDVIQLDPEHHTHHDGFWAGQLLFVDEVKAWGVTCHAQVQGGMAHYRAAHGTYARVGTAPWLTLTPTTGRGA